MSWLFGDWSFGQSSDETNTGRHRTRPFDDREAGEETNARVVGAETDDGRLVAQIRAGDAVALDTLFLRYYTPLVEFAASYVGSIDEGEEVVADVLAWLWEHRTTLATTASVSAYLFGAVRNRALNAVKRRAFHHQRTVALSALGESPGTAPTSLGPLEQVERDDDTAILRSLIAKLPERRRLILSLRWTHDLAWDEIAAVLGVTTAALHKEHARILTSLRADLQTK